MSLKLIKQIVPHSVEVIDKSIGLKERLLLSNKRFCKEFHLRYEIVI